MTYQRYRACREGANQFLQKTFVAILVITQAVVLSIRAQDTTPPVVTCAANKTVECGAAWSFGTPTVTDNSIVSAFVYNNSTNDLATRFETGNREIGNEIILAGYERYLTRFSFEFWATNAANGLTLDSNITVRLRFYANNGAPYSGYPMPGTLLYDSGAFSLGNTGTERSTLLYDELDLGVNALVPLVGAMPDSFTWSVQFGNLGANDHVGADLYSPAVVGQAYGDYWERVSASAWELKTNANVYTDMAAVIAASSNQIPVSVVSTVTNAQSCPSLYSVTRTWGAVDASGNSNWCSQTVTIQDTTPPVVTCAANKTVECGAPWSFGTPTATDNSIVSAFVYNNSTNDLATRFETGNKEIGNEIILAGYERYLTGFSFEFWATNSVNGLVLNNNITVRLRFYANDGAPYSGYPMPGTLLYDSGAFSLGNTGTERSTLLYNELDLGVNALLPLVGALPDSFTWSVEFGNLGANDHVGADLYSPPVVGQAYGDYWERVSPTSWELKTNANVYTDMAAVIAASSNQIPVSVVGTVTNALSCPSLYAVTRTWRALDACGNSNWCSQTVTIQDTSAPMISSVTATQFAANVINCASNVVQGNVYITVNAADNCGITNGHPTVSMVNGLNSDFATCIATNGTVYTYVWTVSATTPSGIWTVSAVASDQCQADTETFTLCVNKAQITGQIQLDSFVGTGTNVNHSRMITFVATTNNVLYGTNVLKTWDLAVTNVSGDTFNYVLTDVPPNANGLSAKTAWNLREKLMIAFDVNSQAVADFVSDGTPGWSDATDHYLRGGDLNGNNQVSFLDYSTLSDNYFTTNPVADINGSGSVTFTDYSILSANWFKAGDPQ